MGVGIGKFLFDYVLKTFLPQNECSGCMLSSGRLPVTLRCGNRLNIIMGWNGHVDKLELNDT